MIYKCSLFQFRSATSIFDEYFHLVLCMSLMHYYKKVADKRSETAAPLFFGMLVFVVCIVACFNEVLLLAFVHYSFTSVSICQNLLIELVDRLNQKSCQGTMFCIRVTFIHMFTKLIVSLMARISVTFGMAQHGCMPAQPSSKTEPPEMQPPWVIQDKTRLSE